jgi:nucleotide-binding universal stress UspA family protein
LIRRILVPLDESSRAAGVLEAALEIAERFAARIRLFRAIAVPPEWPAAAAGNPVDRLPGHLTDLALAELDELGQRAAGRVAVEPPIARTGEQPWRLIVALADELDVDLVVIGSHGYHGVDRVLGTNAARVVNFAHCNVLVAHDRAPAH